MVWAYSTDFRKSALRILKKNNNKTKTAEVVGISSRTLARWEIRERNGKLKADSCGIRPPKKIHPEALKTYVLNNPDKTLMQIGKHFGCSDVAVLSRLKKLKITYKKKSIYIRNGTKRKGKDSLKK